MPGQAASSSVSELILVRHGQATPFEQDTDQLSPLGAEQARAVGEFLADVRPTHLWHGPLVRQRRTAELAGEGRGWPAFTLDPRLAEFDGDGLVKILVPKLAAQDDEFARLVHLFREHRHSAERNSHFQRMLEHLAAAWQAGSVLHAEVEPWTAFKERVQAVWRDLLALPKGSTVVAFTSGGVIGLLVTLTLDAPDAAALKLNWRVKNGSITRLTFGGGRMALDTFNSESHLDFGLRSWR